MRKVEKVDNHMDVSQLVQQKLNELGLGQRDLADAAEVTESFISQLLSRKKMPPAPERTDIYDKLGRCLKLPAGKLAGLAYLQSRNSGRRSRVRRYRCSERFESCFLKNANGINGAKFARLLRGSVW